MYNGIPKGFKQTGYLQRYINRKGDIVNIKGRPVKERNTKSKTRCVSVTIDGKRTSCSIDYLFKAAFYPKAVELLPIDGDRYNFYKNNLLPLMEEERGKSWGYSEKYKAYVLRDGSVYGSRKYKLKGVMYDSGRLRYSLKDSCVLHIAIMLDAFGYKTSVNMFDIDLTKSISFDEILKGYKGYPVWVQSRTVHPDDYVYTLEGDGFKPKRIMSRTAVYDRVRYAYTGEVVGKDGLSIKPDMVGIIPYYKNKPVKVGVYSAFSKNKYDKLKHAIVVKDGNEQNTAFKNLEIKDVKW